MVQTVIIRGMHCQACVAKITSVLEPLTTTLEVTFQPPQAKLTPKSPFSLEDLNKQLASIGDYKLISLDNAQPSPPSTIKRFVGAIQIYYPLILIIAYVLIVALLSRDKTHTFMAGFFLVFSGFKFLNLAGFADAYATYDWLAKRWRPYGFIYPFLELGLGLAYLTHWQPLVTYLLTVIIMGFSSLGVIEALLKKQKIQCACLGTVLNLPMTVITLVEDLAMVIMALIMLLSKLSA